MNDVSGARGKVRRALRRNLFWLVPAVLAVGAALFYGIGSLLVWLWRVTLVDIFAIKPISFWQAWGLILLSQFLFKANMQPAARTGRWRRRRDLCGEASETGAGQSPQGSEG